MHYREVKGILINNGLSHIGMNLYRGCSHGCIYCDSRSKCYQINHDFEDIEIKSNALELLEQKLKTKRKKCMIGTGSMTDPYLHIEKKIEYTRKSLEIISKYGFGLSILTKSNMILRDLDILKEINMKSKCIVQMTLTTYDEELCKILEPNVSTTKERFEVLKTMTDNNIETIVWLGPILPYINDTEENLRGILDYCVRAKVYGIICFGMGMTLREGNREYFYEKLDLHFPGLKEKYQNKYGNSYQVGSPNNNRLMNIFYNECKKNNIICDNKKLFEYLNLFPNKYVQLDLFC
jgi:DNA repair photolyase